MLHPLRLLTAVASLALAPLASALTITIDYSYDTTGFFSSNAAARAALDAAALDLGNAIQPSLSAISTNTFVSTIGSNTADIQWDLQFRHPVTEAVTTIPLLTIPQDTVTIYAGMRAITGGIGEGGPGGGLPNIGVSGPGPFTTVVGNAVAASNTAMVRGGPIVETFPAAEIDGVPFTLSYGVLLGSISFDNDTNGDGITDSAATLANVWHFDHTIPVEAGKLDFYSTALHELMHSIGAGTSDSWDDLVSGTTWNGDAAIALNGGTGTGLLDPDGGHIAEGYMSDRLIDGILQEAVLDPTLLTGQRKYLTEMDLAMLNDIGYAVVPEVSSAGFVLAIGLAVAFRRRRVITA